MGKAVFILLAVSCLSFIHNAHAGSVIGLLGAIQHDVHNIGVTLTRRLHRVEGGLANLRRRFHWMFHGRHGGGYGHHYGYGGYGYGGYGYGYHYKDCWEIHRHRHGARSGVYTIRPRHSRHSIRVYCDMTTDGGGWTVFQRRRDGSVDFYRSWHSYRRGFGHLKGEFWLGLDNIHKLTSQKRYQLRVDMQDRRHSWHRHSIYNYFRVADRDHAYQLSVSGYHGNGGNSLQYHNGAKFSTRDVDHDTWGSHCAISYHGGWWFKACHYSNLNGRYYKGAVNTAAGVAWYHFPSNGWYSLKFAEMKVRPYHH